MTSLEQIDAAVSGYFSHIEFKGEPAGLYDPLRYMMEIGGKRIRPALAVLSYSLFKDTVGEEILEPAAALEVFHSFTLLHDDIMDRSPLRRGKPTVWTRWSPDTAILSGDVMMIDSYRRIAKAPAFCAGKVLQLFTGTAAGVCEGQQYDMEFESVPQVSMADYEKMIGLKTAVLIACSAKVGALVAGASDADVEALYDYGYRLGMAFQVADDYLDAYGDSKVFGKPIGGDIVNNKKSWLITRALEKSQDRDTVFAAMSMPVDTPEQKEAKIRAVKDIYASLGIADDAQAEVRRFSDLALEAVSGFDHRQRALLKEFADRLVGRAK